MKRSTRLLDVALLLSLLAVPLAWIFDPFHFAWGPLSLSIRWGWKPILAPVLLFAFRAWLRARGVSGGFLSKSLSKKLVASWLATWGFFIGLEGVLALAGVEPEAAAPIVIRGEEDHDITLKPGDEKVVLDPELLWRFAPGRNWAGIRINRLGFRDREFTAEKPAGTRRVIAMGDSCTAQGMPPYSALLHLLLQSTPPTPESWHAYNTGVFGYSALQGLRQFQLTVRHFQPDVVTLYYGWNDHWLRNQPDHMRMAVRLHPARAALTAGLQKKRLFGVLARAARGSEKIESKAMDAESDDGLTLRVPPAIYRATLTEFVHTIREAGAVPILITAPSRTLTRSAVRGRTVRNIEEGNRTHAEYVAITREVAEETGAHLLDLAAIMEDPAHDQMFSADGIHLEQPGLEFIAQRIHEKLIDLGAAGKL